MHEENEWGIDLVCLELLLGPYVSKFEFEKRSYNIFITCLSGSDLLMTLNKVFRLTYKYILFNDVLNICWFCLNEFF